LFLNKGQFGYSAAVAAALSPPQVIRPPLLDREYVLAHRRRRFAAAAAECLHDGGSPGTTVTAIVARTRSSRNSFYEVFDSVADCLAFAVSDAYDRLLAPVRDAEALEAEWGERVALAVGGFYEAVSRDPLLAELFLIHSHAVQLVPGARGYEAGIDDIADLLARGRVAPSPKRHGSAPAAAEEYWACVLLEAAAAALRREELDGLASIGREIVAGIEATFLRPAQPRRRTSARAAAAPK
jgi:AcrR family transcriptional regulator